MAGMEERMARMEERMEERMRKKEEEIEEKMTEVEDKMRKEGKEIEAKLVAVEEKEAELRNEMKEEMEEKEAVLRKKMKVMEEVLRKELASKEEMGSAVTQGLRDLPYLTLCAYQDSLYPVFPSSTITYDSFLTDFNNGDQPGGADGQLDLGTGVFTCLSDGIYSITFSGYAQLRPTEGIAVYLYLNEVQVPESLWQAYTNPGTIGDTLWVSGSRSLVSVHLPVPPTLISLLQMLPLQLGDTLELRTEVFTGYLGDVILCIELADQGLSARP